MRVSRTLVRTLTLERSSLTLIFERPALARPRLHPHPHPRAHPHPPRFPKLFSHERFCSAFADVDAPFGSLGSFFTFHVSAQDPRTFGDQPHPDICGSSLRLKLAGQPRAARDYAPRARRSLLLAAPCRSLLPACCCLHALTSPLFELRVWKANRWLLPGQPTLRATDSAGRSSACRGAPNAGGGSRPGQLALTISPHLSMCIYISAIAHRAPSSCCCCHCGHCDRCYGR